MQPHDGLNAVFYVDFNEYTTTMRGSLDPFGLHHKHTHTLTNTHTHTHPYTHTHTHTHTHKNTHILSMFVSSLFQCLSLVSIS